MRERNLQFSSLSRELALMGLGILGAAALVGAGIGVAVDVLIHRRRAA